MYLRFVTNYVENLIGVEDLGFKVQGLRCRV